MDRYSVVKEVTKNGRRTEVYWGVRDAFDNRIIVRYSTKKEAEDLIKKYNEAVAAKS